MSEHPVWKVLYKQNYIPEFYPQAEAMYDFLKSLTDVTSKIQLNGKTVSAMKVLYNMWNNYSSETFCILQSLVEKEVE